MICGQPGSKSNTVIKVAGGDRIGAYWGHIIGGQQFPNDVDHPIAKSHKGPVMAYLAKVDNAATAGVNGLKWYSPVAPVCDNLQHMSADNERIGSRSGKTRSTLAARRGAWTT
jgi:hypothetical protein